MRRAVVVGAGIGGVTTASALARNGWQVLLLERAAELGEVGAGISIWPAAMRVLDSLGVAEQLRGESSLSGSAGVRRLDGKWLAAVDSSGFELPALVHRARLHEAILGSLPETAEVRTGVSVTAATLDGILSTEAGETIEADLIVAADGIRSVVRRTLNPDGAPPRYAGYTAYRGIAPAGLIETGGETWGRAQRFGYVRMVDGRAYWYATVNVAEGTSSHENARADLQRLFGDWHDPIPALLEHTPAGSVLNNDLYDLPLPLASFAYGKAALLGDAAHAMTPNMGQGACAAIEDAAALVRQLDEHAEVADALRAYDAERRRPTAKLIRRSRQIGNLGQLDSRVAVALRDVGLRVTGVVAGLANRRRAGRTQVGQSAS